MKRNQLAVNEKLENDIDRVKGWIANNLFDRNILPNEMMWDDVVRCLLVEMGVKDDYKKAFQTMRAYCDYIQELIKLGQIKVLKHWDFDEKYSVWKSENNFQQNAKSEKVNPFNCGECFGSGMKLIERDGVKGSVRCDCSGAKLETVYEDKDIKSFLATATTAIKTISDPIDIINERIARNNKEFFQTDHSENERLAELTRRGIQLMKEKKQI